jgi:hypothetical protein
VLGLSALAVTLSLMFVGLEIRQSTSAMRSATMKAISDTSSDLLAQLSTDDGLASLLVDSTGSVHPGIWPPTRPGVAWSGARSRGRPVPRFVTEERVGVMEGE